MLAAHAQTVRWEADPRSPSMVSLVFEDCAPEGEPELPSVSGATFSFVGQSESVNIVNFQMTRSVTRSYLVRGRQNAPVQIPVFTVQTNKGAIRVAAYNAAAPAAALDSIATAKLIPEKNTLWAGEVFKLNYELTVPRRNNPQISETFEWNAAPLIGEPWSKLEGREITANGERRIVVSANTRLYAKTPNTLKLEAANHILHVQTGTVPFGLFSQARMEPISVPSDQPVLEIRPLPSAPGGFNGAVGEFKLVSKIVPEKAAIGEPITWTLELSGTGNWPDIPGLPAREVSNDFQVVQPKAKRAVAEGKLFDVTLTEDVVLVPAKAGSYTLGPVSFVCFDPKSGRYQTLSAPRTTVTITSPTAPLFSLAPTASPAPTNQPADAATSPARHRAEIATPPAPTGIPRDPLPGSDEVRVPFARETVLLWVAAPFAGLLVFWAGLAIRQARFTDPERPRREARARLTTTLSHLQTATDADRPALLLAWQRDAAVLWQLNHAAPPAAALRERAWSSLWLESDRTLYGAKVPLPSDWVARAQEALVAKRVPAFRPWRLFLRRNLMPFAAVLACAFVLLSSGSAEETSRNPTDPIARYHRGEFSAAEKAWREMAAQRPTDWIGRHNLALALAQQERDTEAAAQAAAAFVQQPSNPSVQWHFALLAEKVGFAPDALASFLKLGPLASLARLASPSGWQVLLIASAFGAAIALGWMLHNAYSRRLRATNWLAAALLALSLVSGASATAGYLAYGITADARAVIVARTSTLRSIPTEADTTQKTAPLAAGSTAIADQTFLGWWRLAFENGQTGWVRKEDLVSLWR